jgi:hypothetical protein
VQLFFYLQKDILFVIINKVIYKKNMEFCINMYQSNKKKIIYSVYQKSFIYFLFFVILYSYQYCKSNVSIIKENQNKQKTNNINNKKIYNQIYYLLTIEYKFFLKKFYLIDEFFLKRLLKKEIINEKNETILINKEGYHFKIILKILNTILKKIKNNFNTTLNTEKLEEFINIINQETQNNRTINQAFQKALYIITENEAHYNNLNSINLKPIGFNPKMFNDQCLITIFWILYSYEKFSPILDNDLTIDQKKIEDEEIFVYSYPLYINSLNKTFNEIKFNSTLIKYFFPFLITDQGISYLINNEKYNKAMNKDMAYHIIKDQKIKLIELLLEEKNKPYFIKINAIMKKISAASKELSLLKDGKTFNNNWLFNLFDVQDLSMQDYFKQYIPEKIFGIGPGINSTPTMYALNSAVKFYESALGGTLHNLWQYYNYDRSSNITNNAYHPFFTNIITESFFPYANAWPFSTSYDKEKLEKYFKNIAQQTNTTIADCYWENKRIYTFQDKIQQYKHIPGIAGKIVNFLPYNLGPILIGGVTHLMATGMAIRSQYFSIKSILSQYKNIQNHYKYFFCLKKLIIYSKQLTNTLIELYESNNILPELILPEIIQMKTILNNKKEDSLINKILSWSNKRINIITNAIYSFFVAGNMAHFYFKELYESIEIEILNNYIGAIDSTLAKIKLLELKKQHPELSFTIPILLKKEENESAALKIKNMWLPSLKGAPIKNSLILENDQKNMMLVSPVAGGKTVLLSTILTQLYLANIGIVAADELEYTYFTNIVDHMRHDYDIGSGISQHLAERKSMHAVKNIAANQKENEKSIIIIDEIYKGTIPQLAVKEAFLDLPPILKKNNIITIVTTHFPEITKITENKELSIGLYYLAVDHIGGIFNRTHKLFKDDEHNWWIRDSEIGLKYQLSQDIE